MTHPKSTTCYGTASRTPLTEYDSRAAAQEGASHARRVYGRELEPYACSRCRWWHLSPKGRRTPSVVCDMCSGADGGPKHAYASYEDAARRAEIIREEKGLWLTVYECPHGRGWHLTKG